MSASSAVSGAASGALSGMALGPWGALAGGALGLAGGLFGGGGSLDFGLTPREQALKGYAFDQVRATPSRKRTIINEARSLREGGDRGAAEALLEGYVDRFTNPEFIEKRLARSYNKPVDYYGKNFQDIASSIYNQQGIGYSPADYDRLASRAKAENIRSGSAFENLLKSDLIASGKVMSTNQQMLADIFGAPERDASGRLTGRYGDASTSTPISKYMPGGYKGA
jgi:hypothetical protein